jgi:hypothetical protein
MFKDAMGLFRLIWQDSGEGRDMAYKVQSKKAGYASTDDTLFMSSFEGSMPNFFGTTRIDTRTLPKAKDHKTFDSGNLNTSFKSRVEKPVIQHSKSLKDRATVCMSSEGSAVAHECIISAASFTNWLFISHSVNAIFESLADEQNGGYGSRTVHGIIWACLKARKVHSEIQLKGFGGHNVVTNVLNQHLQASASLSSDEIRVWKRNAQHGKSDGNSEKENGGSSKESEPDND